MTLRTIELEKAKQVLRYEPETGNFCWIKTGKIAGCHTKTGYVIVGLSGKLILAHRLAWAFMTGDWSKAAHIDHINRKRNDNRWANLREASVPQNLANSGARSSSKSGVKGVSWCKATSKWRATINCAGKQISLGRHESLEDAASAYQVAACNLHGQYAAASVQVWPPMACSCTNEKS